MHVQLLVLRFFLPLLIHLIIILSMKRSNSKLLLNFLFNCIVGVLIAFFLGFSPVIGAIAINIIGLGMHQLSRKHGGNVAYVGLAAEVWLPLVMEDPYPKSHFLSEATDMSALVEYDKINLAEAGIDPNVIVDNTVYPVPIVAASDVHKELTLKTYDTENTVVRNAIAIELSYDQRALYAAKHKKALAKKLGLDAAYMYAPSAADASKYNSIVNLGANDSIIDGIIDLQSAYDIFDADEDRILVLSPQHKAKIAKEDKALYKAIIAEPGAELYGFKIYTYSRNPIYIAATGIKAAAGAAFVPETHKYSSFAFVGSEVMVADGSAEMFSRLKDPEARGDIFGFQKRALALPIRGKYQGAILQ